MLALFMFSCADKSHMVMNAYNPGDDNLSCSDLQNETIKAELIIDAVNKDKESVSGAEVFDAVMWGFLPYLAKSNNHKDALEGANNRLKRLNELKETKQCSSLGNEKEEKKDIVNEQLRQLKNMYEAGDLTKDEYNIAVEKLFE